VIDVDVRGDADIEYDVSRTRLVGTGSLTLRVDLREAVEGGLRDMGIYDRLVPVSKRVVDTRPELIAQSKPVMQGKPREIRLVDDEELLQTVAEKLPKDEWPLGIHKRIAEACNISYGLAYRAISTLLIQKRVIKPSEMRPPERVEL